MDVAPWVEPDPPEAERITELLATDPELPAVHPEIRSWVPDTTGKAEWAMAKMARAQQLVDGLAVQRAEFIERIEDWYLMSVAPLARTVDFFSEALARYGLERREFTGAATTVLPSGKVSTRKAPATVTPDDEAAVIAWAEARGYYHAVPRRLLVSEVRKLVTIVERPVAYRATFVDGTWRDYRGVTLDDVPVCVGEVVDGVILESLEPVLVPMAVDSAGVPVPGLSVREEQVTATVKPT